MTPLCVGSLQPNGLQVLHKVPNLVESIKGVSIGKIGFYSVLPQDKSTLAEVKVPERFEMLGVRRAVLHKAIIDTAVTAGVEIKWGHKLESLEQTEDSVIVTFENGHSDTASFVVGCDGLHSNTRICLFGAEKADFTGLIQVWSMFSHLVIGLTMSNTLDRWAQPQV